MRVERVGVCLPARDEAAHIGPCIRALAAAARAASCRVVVVLVADGCTDATVSTGRRVAGDEGLDLRVRVISARSVGTARRTGLAFLRSELDRDGTWLATTDADSTVPPDWITRQSAYAAAGSAVVVGTVVVQDWADDPPELGELVRREYARRSGPHHGHIHGANLGFTAAAHDRVGGFSDLAAHEDVAFVRTAERLGLPVTWAEDIAVTTSARAIGRTPVGFAHHLSLTRESQVMASAARVDPN